MSAPVDDAQATTLRVTPTVAEDEGGAGSNLAPGTQLGRYHLEERLGAGAMGVVWSATDPQLDRRVAIKVVHPRLARTAEASSRLRREARAMAKVSHRGVVIIHDVGDVDGRLFIAMELVQGTTLGHMLRTRTAHQLADWQKWLALVMEAGRGLAAAHREGVLHRDFKPDNVLVEHSGRVCVADFGLATLGDNVVAGEPARDSVPVDLTTTGTLLGTPAYMSPQQLRSEAVDARADQFSFCVACWEALYGARPYANVETRPAALVELLEAIETKALRHPEGSAVPSAIREILLRGLEPDVDARWLSMDHLLDVLDRARIAAAPPARRRKMWLAAGALAAVAVIAFAFALGGSRKEIVHRTPGVAKRLYDLPQRTHIAVSPDGTRLAYGGRVLEIHDLVTSRNWSLALPATSSLGHIELDRDAVRFGDKNLTTISSWRYTTSAAATVDADIGGLWFGRTARGDLVFDEPTRVLRLVEHGREVGRWNSETTLEVLQVSPDGARFAYLTGGRFAEHIVIRSVASDRVLTLGPLPGLTAIAWRDNETLLYATGASEQPEVQQVQITPIGLGAPREVFGLDAGWFGELAAAGHQLFYVEMGLSTRARIIDRAAQVARDLESGTVAAPLAWIDEEQFLTWSRSSRRVVRRTAQQTLEPTQIELDGEPANATIAGGVLIATLRRAAGRLTVAHSLQDGRLQWRHDDLHTFAVRCAGDISPPCFAVRSERGRDYITRIDSATGELGATVFEGDRIEDVAVHRDGTRLLVAFSARGAMLELATDGSARREIPSSLLTTRSVAYDSKGGFLVAGTAPGATYQAGHLDESGRYVLLTQAEDDILSLVRPSPNGLYVTMLSRLYAPALWQVALPPR